MWKPGNSSKIICWHSILVLILVFGAFIAASSCQESFIYDKLYVPSILCQDCYLPCGDRGSQLPIKGMSLDNIFHKL
jgi:hypothetical protein